MIYAESIAQHRPLAQLADELQVGEAVALDYGTAKSSVTALRRLQDGRKWSLVPDPTDPKHRYLIKRRA